MHENSSRPSFWCCKFGMVVENGFIARAEAPGASKLLEREWKGESTLDLETTHSDPTGSKLVFSIDSYNLNRNMSHFCTHHGPFLNLTGTWFNPFYLNDIWYTQQIINLGVKSLISRHCIWVIEKLVWNHVLVDEANRSILISIKIFKKWILVEISWFKTNS